MNPSTALALTAPAARPLARWLAALAASLGRRRDHASATASVIASRSTTNHHLPQGQTLVIADALGQMVVCQSGCVWITYDRDPMDRIIEAGECHQGNSHSRMLVHAVSDVHMTVTSVQAA
jgi:hypothetical protein